MANIEDSFKINTSNSLKDIEEFINIIRQKKLILIKINLVTLIIRIY